MCNLREDLCVFLVVPRTVYFFLKREMLRTKILENFRPHVLCSVIYFSENRGVYNMEKYGKAVKDTDHNIWRMRYACRITKATNTNTQYITLIAFEPQK